MNGRLRRGDVVEVKRPDEILATLDDRGSLDGLPFMPEMIGACGRRFTVERRTERLCDTVTYTGTRRMADGVLLEDLRCDGSAHGGCQAECRILWKEAWVSKVDPGQPAPPPVTPAEADALRRRIAARTQIGGGSDGAAQRWRCQATELPRCTSHVPLWSPLGYARELTSGNVRFGRFARVMSRAVVKEPMRKFGLLDEVHFRGTAKKGEVFPALDLQPGEWVRVKSPEEIVRTLNAEGRNRGLWFDREMVSFCGGTYRVRQRVRRFVNERDGSMVELSNDAITLDGVVCSGDHSLRRWFCARELYPFWRECWLTRVESATAAGTQRAGRSLG